MAMSQYNLYSYVQPKRLVLMATRRVTVRTINSSVKVLMHIKWISLDMISSWQVLIS